MKRPTAILERVLPSNLEAERSVLGAMLIDEATVPIAEGLLRPDEFFRDAHRRIYLALNRLSLRGATIDHVTLRDEVDRTGELDEVGGIVYLAALVDGVPRAVNVRAYAHIVKEKALLRRLITAGASTMSRAYAAEESAAEIVRSVEADLFDLQSLGRGALVDLRDGTRALTADLEYRVAHRGQLTGVETGFAGLNALTMGWQCGELVILAARPSIGKTTFAINNAVAAAKAGSRVAIFSLEMRRQQLEYRILSSLSNVPLTRLLGGAVAGSDYARVSEALEVVHDLPILIDDTAGRTTWEIRAACRQMKVDGGLGLVVIDYVQLMPGTLERRGATRNEEITDISRRLKHLADELSVPVLLLSQLNRGADGRADPKPKLSDLRESGALEQDADIVAFLHRKNHREGGYTSLILEKQRNGPTGTCGLTLDRDIVTFVNGGEEPVPAPPTEEDKQHAKSKAFARRARGATI